MAEICIEVDNQHLKSLLSVAEGAQGALPLTTLHEGQNRASIRLYEKTGARSHIFYEFQIDNLQATGRAKPQIDATAGIRNGQLHLEFFLFGVLVHSESIQISHLGGSRPTRPLHILLPLLLALAIAVLLFISRCPTEPAVMASPSPPLPQPAQSKEPAKEESPEVVPPAVEEPEILPEPVVPPEAIPEISLVVRFLPNDASLTVDALRSLDELLASLDPGDDVSLSITGHCALFGTEQGRIELSLERAKAVSAYLSAHRSASAEPTIISARGGQEPITRDVDLQHLNRRVEIRALDPSSR